MFREYDLKRYDVFLVILITVVVIYGIIAIKSATFSNIDGNGVFVNKQIIGFCFGFVIMIITSFINYRFIAKFYWVIYIVNLLLLIAVLVLGKTVNGAKRWIDFGAFSLQASEFCKTFMAIFLARFIDRHKDKINKPWFLLITAILTFIPTYLIIKEPNLSTSLVVLFILVVMIFVGGINIKYVISAIIIFIPLFVIGFWYIQQPDQKLLEDYQVSRIMTLVNSEEASPSSKMQTENSIQAIGSGQLFGKGLYKGKLNKYNYLPEPQTDFIFSIIGEELGFVGCSIVLILILMVILRCLWIAKDAKDMTATLIIMGFIAVITSHTFINVGVTTGILPNTGVPLPFVSYGLSSLWSNMIAVGLILNISMQRKSIYY